MKNKVDYDFYVQNLEIFNDSREKANFFWFVFLFSPILSLNFISKILIVILSHFKNPFLDCLVLTLVLSMDTNYVPKALLLSENENNFNPPPIIHSNCFCVHPNINVNFFFGFFVSCSLIHFRNLPRVHCYHIVSCN